MVRYGSIGWGGGGGTLYYNYNKNPQNPILIIKAPTLDPVFRLFASVLAGCLASRKEDTDTACIVR